MVDRPTYACAGGNWGLTLHCSGYWKLDGATNASMEGFNGKVRWLIKQAYGFKDFKYFRLKIFDLPSTDIRKRL